MENVTERKDVYSRITAQIVGHLEKEYVPGFIRGMQNMPLTESREHCAITAKRTAESMYFLSGCQP